MLEKDGEMPNDNKPSSRIEILRFPLIVGVVFIHNYAAAVGQIEAPTGASHDDACVQFVRFFVSRGVAQVAVPLFFMISGYLFFLGEWSWEKYAGKLKRRLHTLLIPYLFWNLLTLGVLAFAESLPQMKMVAFSTRFPPVHSFSCFDYLNALFGLTVLYPISAQFWFIRDLMALVVLAPAIYFLFARRLASPLIVVVLCLWFFTPWPLLWLSMLSSCFFCLGAYLSRPGVNLAFLDRFGAWISAIFLGILILYSSLRDSRFYLPQLVIVFGVPSIWWLAGLAARTAGLRSLLMGLSGASFFVFAAHQPLLTIVIRFLYKLLAPASPVAILTLFFSIPVCLIAILVLAHRLLLKTMPSFVGLITGSSYRPKSQPG
jgi:surface polysaccharide O-acyltransferase-like enzyme